MRVNEGDSCSCGEVFFDVEETFQHMKANPTHTVKLGRGVIEATA